MGVATLKSSQAPETGSSLNRLLLITQAFCSLVELTCPRHAPASHSGDKKSEGRLTSLNSASQTRVEFAASFADTAPAVKTFFELSSPDVPLPGTVNTLFRARAVRQILTALNSASQRTRRKEYSTPQTPQEFF